MTHINISSFLDLNISDHKPIGWMRHPASDWGLEEKRLYLQSLASVLSDKLSSDEEQYLRKLIDSLHIDMREAWQQLESRGAKEKANAAIAKFRGSSKAQLLAYEGLALSQNNEEAAKALVGKLDVSQETWKVVQSLYKEMKSQAWQKSIISLSSQSIDPSLFRHLYEEVGLENILLGKLIEIPAGSFKMGGSSSNEQPVHQVDLRGFKMQEAQLTFDQWDLCVTAGGCAYQPSDQGWGKANRPVINVSYDDITQLYLPWLNRITGKNFRLPSEAEWEYACRAGTTTEYSWGNDIGSSHANYNGSGHGKTVPVKSYKPNAFGLYDMHGNVWEWTQDCWNGNYNGAPADGSAWQKGDCSMRVFRGGSWGIGTGFLRSAYRGRNGTPNRLNTIGFRLVQDC